MYPVLAVGVSGLAESPIKSTRSPIVLDRVTSCRARAMSGALQVPLARGCSV